MRVVINRCFGGFSVSRAALHRLRALGCKAAIEEVDEGERWPDGTQNRSTYNAYCRDIPRNDPLLVQVVEEMGEAASGECAKLRVVEVPDGVEWEVSEYDGSEHVAERHRTWA